ncbi:hypothetical protein PN497_17630 [Sphaerospermopsis kisseleviana CS-549]|uniref:Transposase n=1 Tax=Sphaerospermopsis kisseleviana CS-549 TaxID=3021783 RepID=A0ABT4ZVV6_9CYAN|nr:hypothetical protein [Sphaerospermopsis kisseleviana]MDB9443169.1 hypothetical protein [Sphaerospermopsis kisseleviana CS-549]
MLKFISTIEGDRPNPLLRNVRGRSLVFQQLLFGGFHHDKMIFPLFLSLGSFDEQE